MRDRAYTVLAVLLIACGGGGGGRGGQIVGIGGGSCTATLAEVGDTISGTLTTFDCRALDTTSIVPDSFAYRSFDIRLAADSVILVSLRTSVFDPALELFDASGRRLRRDDAGGSSRSYTELLVRPETPGLHSLRVRGTTSRDVGDFVLVTTPCGGRRLTVPDSVTGQTLAAGDCILRRFSPIAAGFEDSSRVDVYILRAGPGDSILVRASAPLFTPSLNLRGPVGSARPVTVGDSTAPGVSELIVAPDSLADYMVIVGGRRFPDAGSYSLVVVQAAGATPRRGGD